MPVKAPISRSAGGHPEEDLIKCSDFQLTEHEQTQTHALLLGAELSSPCWSPLGYELGVFLQGVGSNWYKTVGAFLLSAAAKD